MKKADILISQSHGVFKIKVEGRASFESSPPIRNLAKTLKSETVQKVSVDLKNCTGMDSTFMGVLAMLGLEARKVMAPMEIFGASDENLNLLEGLGLKKLFNFVNEVSTDLLDTKEWERVDGNPRNIRERAETVYEAHDTLMDVDAKNVPKFEKVVDLTRKDLDAIKERERKEAEEKGE